MEFTYNQLFGDDGARARTAIKQLGKDDDLPTSTKVRLVRVLRGIERERENFDELRVNIVNKYLDIGYDRQIEALGPSPTKKQLEFVKRPEVVQPPETQAYYQEYEKLLKQKVDIRDFDETRDKMGLSTLGECIKKLTVDTLIALDWLFIDDLNSPLAADKGGLNRKDRRKVAATTDPA